MSKKQKTQVVNFANDYWSEYKNINSAIMSGQCPMLNMALMVNNIYIYMKEPDQVVKGKPFEELDEIEKDEFFKRKNEYFIINKVLNRVIRDLQDGKPISNTFECDVHDQEAQLNAIYKLVHILMYVMMPMFQKENGKAYYYLIGYARQIIDNYYIDVKDDQHIENRYRDPTLTQIIDSKIGKTAEQSAQLQKYSKFNGITHEFKIYNDLLSIYQYLRLSIIKYYPKNASHTLSQNTELNLLSTIEQISIANRNANMLFRINGFKSASDSLHLFIVNINEGVKLNYMAHHKYLTITDKVMEVQKMLTSLINKLIIAYNNGQTNAFEPLNKQPVQNNTQQVQTQTIPVSQVQQQFVQTQSVVYPKGSVQNSGYNISYFKPQNSNGNGNISYK